MPSHAIPYLTIRPDIEKSIEEDLMTGRKSPFATPDGKAQRREANPHDEATVMRPAFARDIEKIMNVPA